MDLGINSRVAIVTGASTGIGCAVALELARNHAHLVMVARDEKRLQIAADEVRSSTNAEVLTVSADVAQHHASTAVIEKTINQFGRVDILINNAGRAHTGGLMQSTETDWYEMTEIKLGAMRRFCLAAIPEMRKLQWGRIVNMSSIGGIYPNPKLLISHALSAAINNITKSLALEVAKDGILVNAIGIGAVATDNWANNMIPAVRRERSEFAEFTDEEVIARLGAELTPVGRFGKPDEIAAVAAFLASDRNGFVTGDTIQASGGADRFM
jgi:3-oxoacyl-[acyl-carrier protein] reductase